MPKSRGLPFLSKIIAGFINIISANNNKKITIDTKFIFFIINCLNILNYILFIILNNL